VNVALASHYARALADAVVPPDSGVDPRRAIEQLRTFERLLYSSKDLQAALVSPMINKAEHLTLFGSLPVSSNCTLRYGILC
jgi:F0F1-type ATP synthase delta subunit